MTKYNPFRWNFGFPEFNMAHRFTYFNSLADTSHNMPQVAAIKSRLYNQASGAVASASSFLSSNMDTSEMESAIGFIEQAAATERQKELDVIMQYKNELASKLPKNKNIDKVLARLNAANLDDPKGLQDFYSELTECINLVRQEADDYLKRLEKLASKAHKTFQDLTKDDYRFRAYGDIQGMINNLTGMATQAQRREETSYAANLRKIVGDYILNNNVAGMLTSGEDFAAIVAAITLDIERLFQEELDKDETKQDFADFTLEEMEKIVKQYTARDKEEQSRVQRAINGDYDSLNDIISAAKNTLGIKSLTRAQDITKRRRSVGQRLSKHDETSSIMKKLQNNKVSEKVLDELKLVQISSKTSQSHGNLFELLQTIIGEGLKVGGTPGTDTITIGSATFDVETPSDARTKVKEYVQSIADEFTKYASAQREDRMKDRTLEFEQMNRAVREAEKQIDDLLKQLDVPIEDLFIYHESLKLYAGMETGKSDMFHGREMVILGFLDELYSLGGLGGLVLPQRDAMTFLALNLADAAVAGSVRGPLEKYFSLFAGLLMFDDIRNIALEASHTLTYDHVKNIHLYNLNGVYVPASMVLTYTTRAIQGAFQEIAAGNAASASISTGGASAAIQQWEDTAGGWNPASNRFEDQWPIVGEAVASGTKVRIAFLASFIDLINNLMSI